MVRTALLLALVLSGCAGGASTETSEPSATSDTRSSPRPTPTTARPTPAPTPRRTPSPTLQLLDVTVTDFGFTYYPGDTKYVQYGVVLENPNLSTWIAIDVSVNITFLSADGTVTGTEDERVSVVPPGIDGRDFAIAGVSFVESAVTEMRVSVRSDLEETDEVLFGNAVFTATKTTSDAYGTTTAGLVGSTYAQELEFVEIVAIYRNNAGAIVGGDTDYVDVLPIGDATIGFEISTLGKIPGASVTELYANP